MAAMAAKGPEVSSSEEAELLVCRKSIEFAVDAGFSELVIEGDNSSFMKAISSRRIFLCLGMLLGIFIIWLGTCNGL